MRKPGIILSLLTALLCFPLSSLALGLGEIEVNSYLNQPLKAEIEVVAARPGEIDDLLVSLASRDAFNKAGLERSADLSKLRFKIEKSEDGQSAKILVTTKTAVKEPFLNFLVEADWAKGRLLREYTVLLDPPSFAQQATPAVVKEPAPVADSQSTAIAQQEPVQTQPVDSMATENEAQYQPEPIALSEQQTPAQNNDEVTPQYTAQPGYSESLPQVEEFVVTKGDTLWGIASQLKDDEHSMAQVMLALQATNPDAFSQGNINNLKVGAVLRTPDSTSLNSLSKQQAYAQVLEQNGLWDEYVARKTGAASSGSPMASEDSSDQESETGAGQLSLLAPGDMDSTTASMTSDESADASQVRKQLALAEEELEASRLENQDLKSRVSELEAQIKKIEELQKMVQIEDSSLAQLQQQSSQEAPVIEPLVEKSSEIIEQQPSDVMIDAAEKISAEETEPTSSEVEQNTDGMMQSSEAETVLPTVTEDTLSDQGVEPVLAPGDEMKSDEEALPAPPPVIVTDTTQDQGIMDMLPPMGDLLADPVILGGIVAIVVMLLILLFIKRRKSSDHDDGITLEEPEDSLLDDDATPIHVPTSEELVDTLKTDGEELVDTSVMEAEPQDEDEDLFSATQVLTAEDKQDAPAVVEEDQDDVLNEVDVYLAYGLYENAEDLLKENLENSPDRADYRAKLLDTYFATRNKDQFIKEAEAMRSLGGAADRYWNRVQIMGFELAPENDLFAGAENSDLSVADLEFTKPETADFDIGVDDDVTDYSNTDFDLSVDTQNIGLLDTEVVPPAGADFVDTQNLEPVLDDFSETRVDDDFALSDLDDENVQLEDLPDEIGDFDLDLGEDAEQAEDDLALSEEQAEEVEVDEDSLSFDLPDDLDLSTGVETSADEEIIELDDTVEAPDMDKLPEMEDDDLVLDMGTDDDKLIDLESTDRFNVADISLDEVEDVEDVSKTMVMGSTDSEAIAQDQETEEGTMHVESALDLDMSDIGSADLQTGSFSPSDDYLDAESGDDITEFRPAEMTGEFEVPLEADLVHAEVDAEAGLEKTGTFAPGDFSDEELGDLASADDLEDISDLMLPDDVDEVGTKLDLAKAFIDMGDAEGARSSLEEVLSEGTAEQKAEATGLLQQIK